MTVLQRFLTLVALRWFPVGLAAPVGLLLPLDRGLSLSEIGLAAAYIVCYTIHGTSNAAHNTLLHRQAESRVRATVVSLNSWTSQAAFAVGAVVLASLAEKRSVPVAMFAAAVILALAAPLYWPAWRQSRNDSPPPAPAC